MIRIAIIGAGSVEFTRNVVADLSSFAELEGQVVIALHDIDAERLAYAERAAASIVRRTGAGFRVEASAERRPAVEGADYANEMQALAAQFNSTHATHASAAGGPARTMRMRH